MHKLRYTPGDPEEALIGALAEIAGRGKTYVLGLGYLDKADDGAGVVVAEELKKPFPLSSYSEHDGVEGVVLDISERAEDAAVFFVDAADLGSAPGTIDVIPYSMIRETEISTHRVQVALLAAILEKAGKRTGVICIQPKSLEFRKELSDEVRGSVSVLVRVLSPIVVRDMEGPESQ